MGQTPGIFFLLFLGLLFLGLSVSAVAYKLGRLVGARLGSIPIRRMVIGRGPVLVRGRVSDIQVELRLVPTGMVVTCAESASMPKQSAVALHLLSGVLGNILVIGLIVRLHLAGAVPTILRNDIGMPLIIPQLGILILAQLMCIAFSVAEPLVYAGSRQIKTYREGTTRPPISTRSLGIVRILYHVARHQRLNDRGSHRKAWAALVAAARSLPDLDRLCAAQAAGRAAAHQELMISCVPDAAQRLISAFTRVFDTLWGGAPQVPGPKIAKTTPCKVERASSPHERSDMRV